MTHLRTPSYLLQRPSGFYFRYQIPARFRSSVGCNELQLPLHINDTHKAKHISTGMALTLKCSGLINPDTNLGGILTT